MNKKYQKQLEKKAAIFKRALEILKAKEEDSLFKDRVALLTKEVNELTKSLQDLLYSRAKDSADQELLFLKNDLEEKEVVQLMELITQCRARWSLGRKLRLEMLSYSSASNRLDEARELEALNLLAQTKIQKWYEKNPDNPLLDNREVEEAVALKAQEKEERLIELLAGGGKYGEIAQLYKLLQKIEQKQLWKWSLRVLDEQEEKEQKRQPRWSALMEVAWNLVTKEDPSTLAIYKGNYETIDINKNHLILPRGIKLEQNDSGYFFVNKDKERLTQYFDLANDGRFNKKTWQLFLKAGVRTKETKVKIFERLETKTIGERETEIGKQAVKSGEKELIDIKEQEAWVLKNIPIKDYLLGKPEKLARLLKIIRVSVDKKGLLPIVQIARRAKDQKRGKFYFQVQNLLKNRPRLGKCWMNIDMAQALREERIFAFLQPDTNDNLGNLANNGFRLKVDREGIITVAKDSNVGLFFSCGCKKKTACRCEAQLIGNASLEVFCRLWDGRSISVAQLLGPEYNVAKTTMIEALIKDKVEIKIKHQVPIFKWQPVFKKEAMMEEVPVYREEWITELRFMKNKEAAIPSPLQEKDFVSVLNEEPLALCQKRKKIKLKVAEERDAWREKNPLSSWGYAEETIKSGS